MKLRLSIQSWDLDVTLSHNSGIKNVVKKLELNTNSAMAKPRVTNLVYISDQVVKVTMSQSFLICASGVPPGVGGAS